MVPAMTILVAGAYQVVGLNVVERLLSRGNEVASFEQALAARQPAFKECARC